jgi:hypothetical protein
MNGSESTRNSNVLFHGESFFPSSHPEQIMYGVISPTKPSVLLHVSLSTIGIIVSSVRKVSVNLLLK